MNSSLTQDIISSGTTCVIAFLVWAAYRNKTVPSDLRYSTFGPRFWTGFVDACVLTPINSTINALLFLSLPNVLAALLVLIQNLVWLFYTVTLHARHGQTVGKMVTGVRVVDFRTEGRISWKQAWLREGIPAAADFVLLPYCIYLILSARISPEQFVTGQGMQGTLWLLGLLPGLWFLAEVVTMLMNKKRRALHDLIAGTVVIRTNIQEPSAEQGSPAAAPLPSVT